MSGLHTWHCISLTAAMVVLPACSDDARPSGSSPDPEDAAAALDASQPTATAVVPDRSNAPNDDTLDAAAPALDGGARPGDGGGPIIGVIDPSDVDVVVVEAAAPLPAVCSPNVERELRVVAALPEGAIPLSITPDGATWAYALVSSVRPDATAPSVTLDVSDAAALSVAPDAGDTAAPSSETGANGAATSNTEAASSAADAPTYSIHVVSAESEWVFTLPSDQDPLRGAALDATGEHLVTTLADTKGFVLWELDETAEQFVIAEDQPFVRLNALAQQGGVRFEKPVFSAGGTRLYAHEVTENTTITQLLLRDNQWETELRITDAALQTQQFSLTAVSADDLTVFGLSAADNHAVAWWRPTTSAAFDTSLTLEGTLRAVSADCDDWWTLATP